MPRLLERYPFPRLVIKIEDAARELIKKYGARALESVRLQIEEVRDGGDTASAAVFKRILKAVEKLLEQETPEDAAGH